MLASLLPAAELQHPHNTNVKHSALPVTRCMQRSCMHEFARHTREITCNRLSPKCFRNLLDSHSTHDATLRQHCPAPRRRTQLPPFPPALPGDGARVSAPPAHPRDHQLPPQGLMQHRCARVGAMVRRRASGAAAGIGLYILLRPAPIHMLPQLQAVRIPCCVMRYSLHGGAPLKGLIRMG